MGIRIPGPPKDVHVNVVLNSEKKGDFRIEPIPVDSLPRGADNDLEFENKGHSGFWIHFHLQDPNNLGYKFPTDHRLINEAVWSKMGEGECPDEAEWAVFTPRRVNDRGMTLIVRNPNEKPAIGKFGYTLRVTKNGGLDYLDLDPGGNNKNGSTVPFFGLAMACVLTGAFVGLGATVLTQNSLVPPNPLLLGLGGALIGLIVAATLGRR